MKRKGIVAIVLVASLVVGVSVALAAHKYETRIDFRGATSSKSDPNDLTFYGDLNSNPKCVGARQVGLFRETAKGSFKLIDIDLSSFNGAFGLRAEINGAPNLAIKVAKEKRNHGKVVCKPATQLLTPAPAKDGAFQVG